MGAPTAEHEARVTELETLATLAGFTDHICLPWHLRPDVVRACPRARGLFVADAKATESPGCTATLRRLRWYMRAVASIAAPGDTVTLALAVRASSDLRAWYMGVRAATTGRLVEQAQLTAIEDSAIVAVRLVRVHEATGARRIVPEVGFL